MACGPQWTQDRVRARARLFVDKEREAIWWWRGWIPPFRRIEAFAGATAVIAPRPEGLNNMIYCSAGTPVFMFPSMDAASPPRHSTSLGARAVHAQIMLAVLLRAGVTYSYTMYGQVTASRLLCTDYDK